MFLQTVEDKFTTENVPFERVSVMIIRSDTNNTIINHVPGEIFTMFVKLKFLSIFSRTLKEITESDLINAKELLSLTITESELRKVSTKSFPPLRIELLDLSVNMIDTIDDYAFAHLSLLEELHLDDNNLTTITGNMFAGLTELLILSLSENEIETIENAAFNDLKQLSILNLSRNKIKVLNDHVFDGLAGLKRLEIAFNQIGNIANSFSDLTSLIRLNLYNNSISGKGLVKFSALPNLQRLDLRWNQLNSEVYEIDSNSTFTSPLTYLDISFNNLTSTEDLDILRIFPNIKELFLYQLSIQNKKIKGLFSKDALKEKLSSIVPELRNVYL